MRLKLGRRLLVATTNEFKFREVKAILGDAFELEKLPKGFPETPETDRSFMGNSLLKSKTAANALGMPALADDSGLCCHALAGFPGVETKDFWHRCGSDDMAFHSLRMRIEQAGGDLSAHAICALSISLPGLSPSLCFEGRLDGKLIFPGAGNDGFFFDKIFMPDGCGLTMAEMPPEMKNIISHRYNAFRMLKEALC